MPQLNKSNNAVAMLIPLDRIKENTNVRLNYEQSEIESLAQSIEQYGQLQPVGVKPADENGFYELVFGYRRHRAFEYLVKNGKPYTQVKAVFATGNTLVLQLVENIQRSDLSSEEKEAALQEMAQNMSQTEIATALNKSRQWVCDLFAGVKVRENATAGGIDTNGLTTKALSVARSVPQEALAQVIDEAQKHGGGVRATRRAVENYQKTKPLNNVVETSLKENPEDSYDFARRKNVDLGEVIAEIANYRHGFVHFTANSKNINIISCCNRIIEILIKRFDE